MKLDADIAIARTTAQESPPSRGRGLKRVYVRELDTGEGRPPRGGVD